MLAQGLVRLWRGAAGIEHHLGAWAAGGIPTISIGAPIMPPLTLGMYFGVVAVFGFPR